MSSEVIESRRSGSESQEFFQWQHRRDDARDRLQRLTPRELQIALLTAHGINSREAAETLGISVKTVEKHRASAYRRLELTGVIGLVRLIVEAELD
jgi:two-component system response regulator FixJ